MVSKSGLDLQRRNRSGPPRNLAPSDFFHVPAKPRQYRNSVPYLAAHGECSRSRRLNRPKSSLGVDKDPHAVRVACFSLYLAMCDEIEPRHYWTQIKFPTMRDKRLVCSDFFDA